MSIIGRNHILGVVIIVGVMIKEVFHNNWWIYIQLCTIQVSTQFGGIHYFVKSIAQFHTQMEREMVVIRVKSLIWQYPDGHGPNSGHNHPTCENRQWEDCYIYMYIYIYIYIIWSITDDDHRWKWCGGLGLRHISIMIHLASSHFQEASPRKYSVQTHRVDGEVN